MASIPRKTDASLPSSAEPSSAARRWKCYVYLSFMGTGTRRRLYCRLRKRGITTFMDHQDLQVRIQVRNDVSATLLKAIEGRFTIVVLSQKYAHPTWWLEKICECLKDGSRIIRLFYHVEPTAVRYKKKRTLEDAFTFLKICEIKFEPKKVQLWRDGTLAGPSGCCTGKPKLTVTNWEKGDFLGSGSFGSVYEGITDGGCFIAVKEVPLLDQGRVSQLEQEIALLSQFEHENIVQYYGTQKDESKLYIFLELVTKGSLQKLYRMYTLTDLHVSVYTRQILQGLKYLHNRKVIHRDIKCANILVHANGSVKLADFGLAKTIKMNNINSFRGTANWMAPEHLGDVLAVANLKRCKILIHYQFIDQEVVTPKNSGYGLPADIWSLGCTVLEMLTRMVPYPNLEWQQAMWKIGNEEPPLVPDSLSREAQHFIHLCLQVKPDDRPTAAQLLKHPFVNKPLPLTSSGSVSPYNHHRQS